MIYARSVSFGAAGGVLWRNKQVQDRKPTRVASLDEKLLFCCRAKGG